MKLNRRSLLLAGLSGAAGLSAFTRGAAGRRSGGSDDADGTPKKMAAFRPFERPMLVPEVLEPFALDPAPGNAPSVPRGDFDDVAHGIAPEYRDPNLFCPDWNAASNRRHEKEYKLITEETTQELLPGVDTPVFTYRDANRGRGSGTTPGPTILANFRESIVVRNENHLTQNNTFVGHDVETSIHWHGGHAPAHADGYPDFYCLAGEARDHFYPNIAPRLAEGCGEPFDPSWIPSTAWYHDHAMDITGFTVAHGLAGFYLIVDDVERSLADQKILPEIGGPQDIGIAIQDQQFNADGTIRYDFLDHNGRIGDVFLVNGVAQPFFEVERRQYRFRVLNASNARFYQLRLSTKDTMLIVGTDTWLLPFATPVEDFEVSPGERHDIIVDFRDAPSRVYLENIMFQPDGRGPKRVDPDERTQLLEFRVKGDVVRNDLVIQPGSELREHTEVPEDQIVATRVFRWERSNGAWALNNRFFNPRRADAVPTLGDAERWIFENHAGGWWHPIHTHLEGFEIKKLNGKVPRVEHRFKNDIAVLNGGGTAECIIQFRSFEGPFVFHCHTIEHEDMRMMGAFDPRPSDEDSSMDGETRIDPDVSGVVPDCEELEEEGRIFADVAADAELLRGRGVGFPECDFDNERRGNRGREED